MNIRENVWRSQMLTRYWIQLGYPNLESSHGICRTFIFVAIVRKFWLDIGWTHILSIVLNTWGSPILLFIFKMRANCSCNPWGSHIVTHVSKFGTDMRGKRIVVTSFELMAATEAIRWEWATKWADKWADNSMNRQYLLLDIAWIQKNFPAKTLPLEQHTQLRVCQTGPFSPLLVHPCRIDMTEHPG